MKRSLVLLFLLPAVQWLTAQHNPPVKVVTHLADSIPGILSFNAPGNPGNKINRDSLGAVHKISGQPAGIPASAGKSQAAVSVQKTSNKIVPAVNTPAKKSSGDSLRPPPILVNDKQ